MRLLVVVQMVKQFCEATTSMVPRGLPGAATETPPLRKQWGPLPRYWPENYDRSEEGEQQGVPGMVSY